MKRELQLEATTLFQKLLSIERSPPIEQVIQSAVVPKFVEFLMREGYPQFEAAWALSNIASGASDNTRVVIENGEVLILSKFLVLQVLMFANRLSGHLRMLLVIPPMSRFQP